MEFYCDRRTGGEEFLIREEFGGPCYQIYYMELGNVELFAENRLLHLAGGELCVIGPGTLLNLTGQSEFTNRRTALGFTEAFLEPFEAACGKETVRHLLQRGHFAVPIEMRAVMEPLLKRLEDRCLPEGDRSVEQFVIRNVVYEYLSHLKGLCPAERPKKPDPTREKIQAAVTAVCERFGEPLSMGVMAEEVGMSQAYFSRQFQSMTGLGFREYVSYVRMKEARRLLRETGEPVSMVAKSCGFGDGNYFGDAFKKIQGVSPLQYRKAARKG